jgi:hypothetical protein
MREKTGTGLQVWLEVVGCWRPEIGMQLPEKHPRPQGGRATFVELAQ